MSPEDLAEIREGYWGRIGSNQESKIRLLFDHIDTQAAQIAALKEMLVSMTTTAIWKASYDSLTGKYTISDADAEKMARQQLKAEIPGVEWE